jgi:hypothetical protein
MEYSLNGPAPARVNAQNWRVRLAISQPNADSRFFRQWKMQESQRQVATTLAVRAPDFPL